MSFSLTRLSKASEGILLIPLSPCSSGVLSMSRIFLHGNPNGRPFPVVTDVGDELWDYSYGNRSRGVRSIQCVPFNWKIKVSTFGYLVLFLFNRRHRKVKILDEERKGRGIEETYNFLSPTHPDGVGRVGLCYVFRSDPRFLRRRRRQTSVRSVDGTSGRGVSEKWTGRPSLSRRRYRWRSASSPVSPLLLFSLLSS